MAEMFREQQTHKFYKAILENSLPADDVIVSMPIGSDPKSSIRIKQGVQFEGRPCTTHFHLLKNLDKRCLVGIRPMTGRTHQIRVHAHYIGCPVTGDKLYGLADDGFLNWLEEGQSYLDQLNFPVSRQLLHAMEITFTHPESKEALTIHADDSKMLKMIPN